MAYLANSLTPLNGVTHAFNEIHDSNPAELFLCDFEHAAGVLEVDEDSPSGVLRADAVFTRTTRPIGLVTADCLPILIASSSQTFVAAIHGGWKGLRLGIIDNALNAFKQAGIDLSELQVAIGPGIKPCCYEDSPSFIDDLEQTQAHLWQGRTRPWSTTQAPSKTTAAARAPNNRNDRWFDLSLYGAYLLQAAGLSPSQIEVLAQCTYCSGPQLASYRRRVHRQEEKRFQYSWICSSGD